MANEQLNVQTKMYIDGQWVEANDGSTSEVTNPATNEIIEHIAYGGKAEAEQAVRAASKAFTTWSKETADTRADYLRKMYQAVVNNVDWLGKIMTLEQGKPFEEAKGEVLWGAEFLLWYAEEARRIYGETIPSSGEDQMFIVKRQPVGVVAAITPWNFPSSMITRKLAPALAAGCTVILKPAPETPLSAIALYELFEQAGLPKGVVNLVLGDAPKIGEAFMENEKVRKLTFTGSTAVGKNLMAQSAGTVKKISLELGGHAPYIVFDDADLESAVDGLIMNKFQNNGQTCICANRVFVHERIADEFADKLQAKMSELKIGNGMEEGVVVGPLIHQEAVKKVEEHVRDAVEKGADLVCGGSPMTGNGFEEGHFYEPTILKGVNQYMAIFKEETFGPVAPIIPFSSDEEAVQMANETPYGLAAYFYTKDLRRTMKVGDELQYGMIGINAPSLGFVQAPFGGMKESGMGREGGRHGLDDFLEYKFLNMNY